MEKAIKKKRVVLNFEDKLKIINLLEKGLAAKLLA